MIFNQKFVPHLMGCLKNSDYLLFEHFAIHKSIPEIPLNFLLRKNEHLQVLDKVASNSIIENAHTLQKKDCTELSLTFTDGGSTQLNFWHRLAQQDINYLEVEAVFSRKQRSESEFFMPNIEHLFEFAVLHHFLNERGVATPYVAYFEDFHFFVKDGLIDFFNKKYNTQFTNLDNFSTFDEHSKTNIVQELKHLPSNQVLRKINMRWSQFWGNTA